jgi:hypothetical protein
MICIGTRLLLGGGPVLVLLEGGPGLAKDARADSNLDFCTESVRSCMGQGQT